MSGLNDLISTALPYIAPVIPPNWKVYSNITYGPLINSQVGDFYQLNHGVCPCVVMVHGGGWASGDKSAYAGLAKKYGWAGYHVFAINYRLATMDDPTTQWNAQLQDVQLAVRWLRYNAQAFRIDPNRIAAMGDSAGGHLALFLGSLSGTVSGDMHGFYNEQVAQCQVVVNMYGPCDLTTPQMKELLKTTPLLGEKDDPSAALNASPIFHINKYSAPTCIIHGTNDTIVPIEQSIKLSQRLQSSGVPYKFITYNGGHGFSDISSWKALSLEMQGLQFISSYMRPNPLYAF